MGRASAGPGPGIMAIVMGDLSRWPEFWRSFLAIQAPPGSKWRTAQGNGIADNRNRIVREMPTEAEWVWFIDDDHTFAPDLLLRLLSHGADVVSPLCVTRKPPFQPYAYRWAGATGHNGHEVVGGYIEVPWCELPAGRLVPVDAVGTGGMLVRRRVLDAVGEPWFEEGRTAKNYLGEDLHFCTKARAAGFRVFVDTATFMGHAGAMEVWPAIGSDGTWMTQLHVGHGVCIDVHPADDEESLRAIERQDGGLRVRA